MLVTKITGTVQGGGYNCKTNSLSSNENLTTAGESKNHYGIWNNVTYHVPWIRAQAMKYSEQLKDCRSGGGQVSYQY